MRVRTGIIGAAGVRCTARTSRKLASTRSNLPDKRDQIRRLIEPWINHRGIRHRGLLRGKEAPPLPLQLKEGVVASCSTLPLAFLGLLVAKVMHLREILGTLKRFDRVMVVVVETYYLGG